MHLSNLENALEHYQKATEKVNLSIQFFANDASHRQQILHQNKPIFVDAIATSYQLYESTKAENYTQTAFDLMNNYKALTLQIQQKESKILRSDIPKKIQQEQENWKNKIANLKAEVYEIETESESENASILANKKQFQHRLLLNN
mgnify:CR=1 FL=1